MNFGDLRALVAVAETGSLAKAAVRLNLTQSAVTRRIQRLESNLAAILLDRDQKPARLTPSGEGAYRQALKVLQSAQELRAGAASPGALGPVRIGVSYAVADTVLGLAVEEVQRATPGVRLALGAERSGTLAKRVAAGDLDAAVLCTLPGRPVEGPFNARDLGRERVVVVAPGRHTGPVRTVLAAVAGERWVINPDGCGFRTQLDRALAGAGHDLDVAVEVWGAELQLSLVARGAGFGLIPARILAASAHRAFVRALDVTDFKPDLAVTLIAGATLSGAAGLAVAALGDAIARAMRDPRSEAA